MTEFYIRHDNLSPDAMRWSPEAPPLPVPARQQKIVHASASNSDAAGFHASASNSEAVRFHAPQPQDVEWNLLDVDDGFVYMDEEEF